MEKLAERIEQLESLVASLVNLNLPPEIHVEALQSKLPEVLEGLKEGYLEAGGEKFWID
ncbi:MAG: hypothetical protein RLZZ381_400 [Cyanobacteriota bacterium]|jgi:hypothetical protein